MKIVELTDDRIAIPMAIKFYMTSDKIVKVVTDLVHQEILDLTEPKYKIIEKVRDHLHYQGTTTYGDWYEDTIETEPINEIYKRVEPFIRKMFPEFDEQ